MSCSGGLVLRPASPCGFAVVPSDLLEQLLAREQESGQLEAVARLLGPWNHPDIFKGRNVIRFIDDMSALGGCVKGGSLTATSSFSSTLCLSLLWVVATGWSTLNPVQTSLMIQAGAAELPCYRQPRCAGTSMHFASIRRSLDCKPRYPCCFNSCTCLHHLACSSSSVRSPFCGIGSGIGGIPVAGSSDPAVLQGRGPASVPLRRHGTTLQQRRH